MVQTLDREAYYATEMIESRSEKGWRLATFIMAVMCVIALLWSFNLQNENNNLRKELGQVTAAPEATPAIR